MDFAGVKALSFDCYGTLIDWELGIVSEMKRHPELVEVDPEVILQAHSRHEPDVEAERPAEPYRVLLREVHKRVCLDLGVSPNDSLAQDFGSSVGAWPRFEDSPDALQRLGRKFKLCILSNVDVESFSRSRKLLGYDFPVVVTAQEVGAYKPDFRMFYVLRDRLEERGISEDQHVHVAQSLYHDHVPAKHLGMRTVWVNRRGGIQGGATPDASPVTPDLTVASLEELADILT